MWWLCVCRYCRNLFERGNNDQNLNYIATCDCNDGYTHGLFCQSKCPLVTEISEECSAHGSCEGSTCKCNYGFTGDSCQYECVDTCNDRGICSGEPDALVCTCFDGYFGGQCQYVGDSDSTTDSTTDPTGTGTGTDTDTTTGSGSSPTEPTDAPTQPPTYQGQLIETDLGVPYTDTEIDNELLLLPYWAYGQVQLVFGLTGLTYDDNRFEMPIGELDYDESFDLTRVDAQQFHLDLCNYLIGNSFAVGSLMETRSN